MCWFVQQFWNIHNNNNLDMSRRKQANPAKLDPQDDNELQGRHLRLTEDETAASSVSAGSAGSGGFDDIAQGSEETEQETTKPLGPYKCTLCGENYLKEKQLREHEQTHTDHLQFTCSYCPRLFKHKRSRDRHTKLHTGDKKYKCQQCESAFSRSDHLKIHMKTHDSRKPYKCGTCNRGYNTAAALSSHQQSHLKQESSRSGSRTSGGSTPSPGLFRCNHCTETFGKPDLLQNHIAMVHSDTDSSLSQTPEPLDDLKIVCMYCSKDFPTLDLMYQHTNIAHCDVALTNGISSSSISMSPIIHPQHHQHSPKKSELCQNGISQSYSCDRCTMQLDSLQNLKNHMNNVHWRPALSPSSSSNKDYSLSYSPFQTQPTDLSRKKKKSDDGGSYNNNNNNTSESKKRKKYADSYQQPPSPYNNDDKPCICSCCYAQLPNFKTFLRHMESHMLSTSTTNLSTTSAALLGFCPVCGEAGRDPLSFTNHIFSHAIAQVPGRCCYVCKKSFERLDELQKHLIDVHVVSVYKCSICNDLFDTKISMQLHLSNKHSDECKHYKCYLCTNQVFHDRLSAELHISMKHYQQFTPSAGAQHHQGGTPTSAANAATAAAAAVVVAAAAAAATGGALLKGGQNAYQNDIDAARYRESYMAGFQCTFCHKTFKDQYSQYVHILKEHNEAKEGEKYLLDSTSSSLYHTPSRSPPPPPFSLFPKILTPSDPSDDHQLLFTCDICNRTDITSESDLISHKKLHHIASSKGKIGPAVSLQCAYCNEYCKSRSDLENHMKTHQVTCGKGKHKCNICDEIFSSTLTLADHKLAHCKIVEGNCCVQCKSVLTDEQSFYTHQLQHSNCSKQTTTQISLPANCIICCQTLQTDVEIKLHAKFHLKHLIQNDSLCGVCNKIFNSQGSHLDNDNFDKNCDNINIFVCKDCASIQNNNDGGKIKVISSNNNNEKEKLIAGNKQLNNCISGSSSSNNNKFACIQCPQIFDSENDVQQHATMHLINDGTNFECRLCKQIFSSPLKLQTHLIEHNFYGMNQFSCYVCSSVFTGAAGLQNHIIGHGLDSRPYECSQCQMKFFFRAELDNHRFVHLIASNNAHHQAFSMSNGYDYENLNLTASKMGKSNNKHYAKLVCKYCSNSFGDSAFYAEHLAHCPSFKISAKNEKLLNNTSIENDNLSTSNQDDNNVINTNNLKKEITNDNDGDNDEQ